MYTDFFGLHRLPFNLTPDPAFLYLPPKHREALAGLTYAILERKGFVVLTGDAGTGKTTLLNGALSRLPADRVESCVILNPTLTASEFLEAVLLDFDIPDVPASKAQRLWKLQEFLARTHYQNRLAVLVVDEAHKLSLEALEEIRLLGNYEGGADKYLQILLLGQSELDGLLNRQDLRQFRQRIALRLYIDPLSAQHVHQYIRFRWAKAGGKEAPPFTPDALDGIAEWSQGIPRVVNSICDSALLMAYGDESHVVGIQYIRDAAANLAPGPQLLLRPRPVAAINDPVAGSSAEKHLVARKTAAQAAQPGIVPGVSEEHPLPSLDAYGNPRANLSLLKRLADRFGMTH
jgi:general secretion pathway protein A